MKKKKKRNRGFTLLELLLAAGIATIIFITVASSFYLGLKVYNRVAYGVQADAQEILNQLSKRLRSAFLSFEKDSPAAFSGSSQSLEFVSVVSLKDAFNSPGDYDLEKIKFYLRPGPQWDSQSLMLHHAAYVPREKPSVTGKEIKLSSRVSSLKFTYYDGNLWQNAWNSTERLPQTVKIFIEFRSKSDASKAERFSTIVDILSEG